MGLLEMNDSPADVIAKMSKGNPGAIDVLCMLHIDKNYLPLIGLLDDFGIYGTEIYILFNDICKRNYEDFYNVLAAVKVDILDKSILLEAVSEQDLSKIHLINIAEINNKIESFYNTNK